MLGIRLFELGVCLYELGVRLYELVVRLSELGVRLSELGVELPELAVCLPELKVRPSQFAVFNVGLVSVWGRWRHKFPRRVASRWQRLHFLQMVMAVPVPPLPEMSGRLYVDGRLSEGSQRPESDAPAELNGLFNA